MSDFEAWDRQTARLFSKMRTWQPGRARGGAGSTDGSEGVWRAKRYHLCIPMDADGTWLDVGCANGHLLTTLPQWALERDVRVEPHGLELLPSVAELARSLLPHLSDHIWAGSVMTWEPPMRFRYVTALDDLVPPGRLPEMVERLIERVVEPGGRLILSSYAAPGEDLRPLVEHVVAIGRPPDGVIHIDRPGGPPLRTVWIDR